MNRFGRAAFASIALHLSLYPLPSFAAPTTAEFMNASTACGGGITVKLDSNLQGSIKGFYESEATKGKATLEILTGIGQLLPQGNVYEKYLDCLKTLLH